MTKVIHTILLLCCVLPLSACDHAASQAKIQAQLDAYDARVSNFEKNGKVVSQKQGMTITPGKPLSVEQAKEQVRKQCQSNAGAQADCNNIQVVPNADGTVTIQYKTK